MARDKQTPTSASTARAKVGHPNVCFGVLLDTVFDGGAASRLPQVMDSDGSGAEESYGGPDVLVRVPRQLADTGATARLPVGPFPWRYRTCAGALRNVCRMA